ncbi:aminoacyl--tRNA ligase-related protein [Streptomyces sp. NPDC055109]
MKKIKPLRNLDYAGWYRSVLREAQVAEDGPIAGTTVIRPAGFAIWERLVAELDTRIKGIGAQNAYFPLLIPGHRFSHEEEHASSFRPELAIVTEAGGNRLVDPVVIRPTSEAIICDFMARWVTCLEDLPILLNQWANVVRWESEPCTLLRSSEILWQEGHTAHSTEKESRLYARKVLTDVYTPFIRDFLGIPVIAGIKSDHERFSGGVRTYTLESMTGDGKALQMGTVHELGQNFARAFDISFETLAGKREFAWTTSWGVSSRLLGAVVAIHGDDYGLQIPAHVAPIQVLILAESDEKRILDAGRRILEGLQLAGVRALFGSGGNRNAIEDKAQAQGYPLRLEVCGENSGERYVILTHRVDGSRCFISPDEVINRTLAALRENQRALVEKAEIEFGAGVSDAANLEQAITACFEGGWARVPWKSVGREGETRANQVGVSVRCLTRQDGTTPEDTREEELIAYLARSN